VLLLGYSYAHLITSQFSIRSQQFCHLALLGASLWFLPIAPDAAAWKPTGDVMPLGRILALLGATIGLPYFLLSTTGPLLQESFHRETLRTPYRLYSLSNIGSLLALLSYPFLFEPRLTLQTQIGAWSWSYALFVICCGWCALTFAAGPLRPATAGQEAGSRSEAARERPRPRDILLWLALAACGSVMLLATTNQMCQEIPSVPFLWVLPLALYLFTFIICFDHERWYHRNTFLVLLAAAVLLVCLTMYAGNKLGMPNQLAVYAATLWVCCMVCHGELASAKPAPGYATLFYLVLSAGGAAGGILVALVAPLVLHDFWEYQIGLVATIVLAFFAKVGRRAAYSKTSAPRWVAGGLAGVGIGLAIVLAISSQVDSGGGTEKNLETARNFYGVLRVNREENMHDDNGPKLELIHGRIQHGYQYVDPDKRRWPTTYYGSTTGIGRAIEYHPRRHSAASHDKTLRIGVVGLGCGTLAAYGQPGDTIRFYEINPEVIRISDEYFTYRKDTQAKVDVVLGDARINMERELAAGDLQRFDVLAVDAFSSDSIPMHLLTKECVELYRKHLASDGLLCVHISNHFLDLSGVVCAIARAVGCQCVFVDNIADPSRGISFATWAIITTNSDFLDTPQVRASLINWDEREHATPVWTDDYGSLWQVLKHRD